MARSKKAKRRPTKRFYIAIATVCAVIALTVALLTRGPSTAQLTTGTISYEETVTVALVRDETVYNATNYGKATFFAAEGQKVTNGYKIAEIYKWGYDESLITDLIEIRQLISDYQLDVIWKEVNNKDLDDIDAKINNKMKDIADVVQGNSTADIVALEQNLIELMDQKQSFLKQNVQADETLNGYYQQEQELVQKLANWKEDVSAEAAGVVSFNLDGAESVMSPLNLDKLTRQDVENAVKGVTVSNIAEDATTRPLYKLVNNYKWYCLILTDLDKPLRQLTADEKFNVVFEGFNERPYEAKVLAERKPSDGGRMYILEMSEDVGPLISVRQTNATLKKDYEGIKVSKKALFQEEDVTGVKVVSGSDEIFIPVEILIEDDEGNVIIQSTESDMPLQENATVLLH